MVNRDNQERAGLALAEARALYHQEHSLRGEIVVLNNLMLVALGADDLTTAEQYGSDILTLCQQAEDRHGLMLASSNLGYIAYRKGQPERAASLFSRALWLARENRNAVNLATGYLNLGDLLRQIGQIEVGVTLIVIAERIFTHLAHNLREEAASYLAQEEERIGEEWIARQRAEYQRRALPALVRLDPWVAFALPDPEAVSIGDSPREAGSLR